jgi:hypothetical protein
MPPSDGSCGKAEIKHTSGAMRTSETLFGAFVENPRSIPPLLEKAIETDGLMLKRGCVVKGCAQRSKTSNRAYCDW